MVDSHVTTGYTSALCHDELFRYHAVKASQILTPCSFDVLRDSSWDRAIEYTSLASYSQVVDQVAYQLGSHSSGKKLLRLVTDPRTTFFMYPPLREYENPSWEFDAPGIRERPHWFLGRGAGQAEIHPTSSRLKSMANWIEPDDEGVWRFFTSPGFVEDFSIATGEILPLVEYDCLLGVGHLGTAMAITLAYYNRESFKGSICSYLGRSGFLPDPQALQGRRILPIEMRIETGLYPVDVFLLGQAVGASIQDYITVFPIRKRLGRWKRIRLTSLRRLSELGITFRSLAG
jgi:hypothetical protein